MHGVFKLILFVRCSLNIYLNWFLYKTCVFSFCFLSKRILNINNTLLLCRNSREYFVWLNIYNMWFITILRIRKLLFRFINLFYFFVFLLCTICVSGTTIFLWRQIKRRSACLTVLTLLIPSFSFKTAYAMCIRSNSIKISQWIRIHWMDII